MFWYVVKVMYKYDGYAFILTSCVCMCDRQYCLIEYVICFYYVKEDIGEVNFFFLITKGPGASSNFEDLKLTTRQTF